MKIIHSSAVSSFGGLNFVLKEFDNLGLPNLFKAYLPSLKAQTKYQWKDIIYSLWSLFYCGADRIEDLDIHLKPAFSNNPFVRLPSPDRVLERLKQLSEPVLLAQTPRGKKTHSLSVNQKLNKLNLKLLKKLSLLSEKGNVLDYDNTIIFTNKQDATYTYKGKPGYYPGVGIIGKNVVYVENRSGHSDAQTLQDDTLQRMFDTLKAENINIDVFRADSASYQFSTLVTIADNVNKFFIKARMSEALEEAISQIKTWDEVTIDNEKALRGEVSFTPFKYIAKQKKLEHLLKSYRLVITKTKRRDGQINAFTGEAFEYSGIITNDEKLTKDEVVFFYNRRGEIEKEFDVLKNDFGWNKMPFSKIHENTAFLIMTAICRNVYNLIISTFSKTYKYLASHFRIKKFIFRFICIPAKWLTTGRNTCLRLYGQLALMT